MFSENKKSSGTFSQQNTISKGTVIVGDISSNGDFRIEGNIEGNINTSGKVVVGKTRLKLKNIILVTITSNIRVFTTCCPVYKTGLLEIFPVNLPYATIEPVNVTAPTKIANDITIKLNELCDSKVFV